MKFYAFSIGILLFLASFSGTVFAQAEIEIQSPQEVVYYPYGGFVFREIPVNSSSGALIFKISNIGTGQNLVLSANPNYVNGSNPTNFIVTQPTSISIAPGNSTNFTIEFTSTITGEFVDMITIYSNAGAIPIFEFGVCGFAVDREINIKQGLNQIPWSLNPPYANFDFGRKYVNGFESATFTVENNGTTPLYLRGDKVVITGTDASMFMVDFSNTVSPIPGGNTTSFNLLFMPTSPGAKTATITVYSDDIVKYNYTFTVTGFGYNKTFDFNGDGYNDVIVGANQFGAMNNGCVYIFYGSATPSSSTNASNADIKIIGENNNDNFGYSVSSLCDINNDGCDEIIIGAPFSASGGTSRGCVYIFYGQGYSSSTTLNANNADVTIQGEADNDWFGTSIGNAGDINYDGTDDIIVGAPYNDNNGVDSGCVYVFFGNDSMSSNINASNANVKIEGENVNYRLGISVSKAGKISDDQIDDIIIGSSLSRVYVFFGRTTWLSSYNANQKDIVLHNVENSSYSGDINDDGKDDIVLTDYTSNLGGASSGAAFIFFGRSSWNSTYYAANADVTISGDSAGDHFGYSISCAGDINGDGKTDIIFGAESDDDNGNNSGCAFIFYGKQTWSSSYSASNADVKLIGVNADDSFGCSVCNIGDFNADGYDDVIVGAYYAESGLTSVGLAYIFYGSNTLSSSIDASNADVDLIGENNNDFFGISVGGGK